MLNHNYLYDTLNKNNSYNSECATVLSLLQVFCLAITYYLYVMFQLYLTVDGNFRGHVNLKLSCFIVYLQTTGVKYCY